MSTESMEDFTEILYPAVLIMEAGYLIHPKQDIYFKIKFGQKVEMIDLLNCQRSNSMLSSFSIALVQLEVQVALQEPKWAHPMDMAIGINRFSPNN